MKQIVEYISSVPTIKNIVLVSGRKCDIQMIKELALMSNIESLHMYVAGKKAKLQINKLIEELTDMAVKKMPQILLYEQEEVYNIPELSKNTALVVDSLDDIKIVFTLDKLKPYYLCGNVDFGSITTFEIWEAFRNFTHEMHLITCREDESKEVLHWQKNKDSDIELSVIFPMYNIAAYLPKCIESVTAWKADYIEFLFVDDGSPDNCAEIVEKAAQTDSRIKLLRKENGGCASARQYGLEQAKGRYVGFIDPDDYIDESMYRKLLRRALMGNYEISYSGYKELYEATGETADIPDLLGLPYSLGTSDREAILNLIAYLRVAIWRGIYLREMLNKNKIGFYTDLRRFDDLPFKVEVFATAKSVVCVPEYLYYYRMARPGQDIAANDERLYVHFPIFEHLDEFARKSGSKELIEKLQIVKLQTHIYAIRKLLPEYIPEYVKNAKNDLLKNIGFFNSMSIYKSGVSKSDRAFFYAIMTGNGKLITDLCKKLNNRNVKREKNKDGVVESINKLTNF